MILCCLIIYLGLKSKSQRYLTLLLTLCVNDWFRKGIKDDRYTDLTKDSLNSRPENCRSLVIVKTNQLVWGILQLNTRMIYKKLKKTVVNAATVVARVSDNNKQPMCF